MQKTNRPETLCLILVLATASALAQNQPFRIVVGPNVLASPAEDHPHQETMLAANPKNPKNLLATSIGASRPDASGATRTYSSFDGGYTWTPAGFAEQWNLDHPFGAADPQVAFGPKGTAYFITLAGIDGKPGVRSDSFYVYRSEDGGKHWERPAMLAMCDHPQIVVDKTGGKYDGNIYIGVLTHFNKKRVVGVFRSEDDGRSFEGPVVAVEAKDGIQVTTPVVMTDGTLFVPYIEFGVGNQDSAAKYSQDRAIGFITSSDGGRTFSSPQPVGVQHTNVRYQDEYSKSRRGPNVFPKLGLTFDGPVCPMFAGDSRGAAFRDRLYAVWNDTGKSEHDNSRILFTYSADRGKSWTDPRPPSPGIPAAAYQYQPALAVNRRGILGIQWFDTRNSPKQASYDLYFTASVDGGQSFLPPKRVTSESSFPAAKGNLEPQPNGP